MNAAVKAALLSGFVFPGAGQMHLKRYGRGLIMMMLVLLGLIIIVVKAVGSALEGLKTLQVGGSPDMNAISNIATTSSKNILTDYWPISLLIVCCWIFSVIDAYRIGKRGSSRL